MTVINFDENLRPSLNGKPLKHHRIFYKSRLGGRIGKSNKRSVRDTPEYREIEPPKKSEKLIFGVEGYPFIFIQANPDNETLRIVFDNTYFTKSDTQGFTDPDPVPHELMLSENTIYKLCGLYKNVVIISQNSPDPIRVYLEGLKPKNLEIVGLHVKMLGEAQYTDIFTPAP